MIVDTIGGGQFADHSAPILKKHSNAKYVTIANHILRYTDQSGLLLGSVRSVAELAPRVAQVLDILILEKFFLFFINLFVV